MDGRNRSVSHIPQRFTRPPSVSSDGSVSSPTRKSPSRRWSVREAPAKTHFARHPMVFRLQLQQAIGQRVVTRLRDLPRNGSLAATLRGRQSRSSDSETLDLARKHASAISHISEGDPTDEELELRLGELLNNDSLQPDQKEEILSLLHAVTDDNPDADTTAEGLTAFNALMREYTPRALAIFLSTGFGSYVLECFKQGENLSEDDKAKMGKGLLHIQSRLNSRASHLPDGPLIEYADLYMGEDIDLENPEFTVPVVMKTLESIREQHEDSLEDSEAFQHKLDSGSADEHLPISLKDIDALRMKDLERIRDGSALREHPVVSIARHIDSHPTLRVLLKDEQLSQDNLEAIATHFSTLIASDKNAIAELEELEYQIRQLSVETSEDDNTDTVLAELSKILSKAATLTDSELNKTTLNLLKNHIDNEIINRTKTRFEQELYKQLSFLEKGGTEKTFKVSIGVGGAAAVAGISAASVGAQLELTFKVTGNDDTKVREFKTMKPTLTLAGGDSKVIEAAVEANSAHTQGKVFRNLEDFIKFHSNDLVPMLMGTLRQVATNTKGSINARRADHSQKQVTADRQLLSQHLAELGVIHPGDQIKVQQTAPVNYADFKQHTVATSAKIQALAGVVSAQVSAQDKITSFTTHTNLLYMLRNNPDKAQPKHLSYMSFWVPVSPEEKLEYEWLKTKLYDGLSQAEMEKFENYKEEDGVVSVRRSGKGATSWMNKQAEHLSQVRQQEENRDTPLRVQNSATQERLAIRETLKKAIVDQYIEREMYYFTVNSMEGSVGKEAPQKSFHDAKHDMQKIYNAKDRGEFIAAHIYSFYHLHQLYKDTFLPGETPELNDEIFHAALERSIEPSLDKPELNLKAKKHVRKNLAASSVARSTERNLSANLNFSIPGTGVGISADVTHSVIGKHVNPDNDGSYLTFGLNIDSGTATAEAVMTAMQGALQKLAAKRGSGNLPEVALGAVQDVVPQMSHFNLQAGMRVECHLVKRNEGWQMQFVRVKSNQSAGVSIPAIGIPTGPLGKVEIGTSASVSSVHNWWERPGNNTLTYIYAKYNGWSAGKMQKQPSWSTGPEEFNALTEPEGKNPFIRYTTQHKQAISNMLINMGKDGSAINHEFYDMLGQINVTVPPGYVGFTEDFARMVDEYSRNPDIERLPKILPEFERFLALQHEVYLKEARTRYKPHYRKGRVI